MVKYGYIFDIIIVRIDTPYSECPDPNLLSVNVDFRNAVLKINPSRINVVDFVPHRSYEFESSPEDLRNDLKNRPLTLQIKCNDVIVGNGRMEWPNSVLEKINNSMGELTHVDECELTKGEDSVGCVELIVRFQCKCQEMSSDESTQNCDDIRQHLHKLIDPNDILFVMSEPKKRTYGCDGLVPTRDVKESHITALDLSRYRNMNGKLVQSPDVLNTCMNANCGELKNISKQYEDIINSHRGEKAHTSAHACSCKSHSKKSAHDRKFSGSSGSSTDGNSLDNHFSSGSFHPQHYDESAFVGEKLKNMGPRISPPNMNQTVHKTPSHCPVCNENISWLPKLAPCPKCGYKPVPELEEEPYNDKLTADEILQEYMDKCSSDNESPGLTINCGCAKQPCEKRLCACTCKNGKMCAHCRIRKLCEDMFQVNPPPVAQGDDCGICEQSPSEMYNVCQSSSKDCRPCLAHVLSEMKGLYDVKGAKSKGTEKILQDVGGQKADNTNRHIKRPSPHQDLVQQQKQQSEQQQNHTTRRSSKPNEFHERMSLSKQEGPRLSKRKPLSRNQCGSARKNVPSKMGWLWNVNLEGKRRGWRPGVISKPINRIMKYFLRDNAVPQHHHRGNGDGNNADELEEQPTLHVCKKNDEYLITLRPLKDPDPLRQCPDPCFKMHPIQFRIVKNPLVMQMRSLKRDLKDMGFEKCTCHQPVINCCCRNLVDKKKLEYQVNKECRKRCMPCCNETLVLSDTTDSDTEFDFGVTPPGAVVNPHRSNKPKLIHQSTQYDIRDFIVTPLYPKPPKKYFKLHNCAAGIRYAIAGDKGDREPPEEEIKKGDRPPIDMMEYVKKRQAADDEAKARKKEMRGKKYGMPSELLCTVMRRGKSMPPHAATDHWFGPDRVC